MLGLVLVWLTVYLTGMLLCKIGGKKETSQLWIHLTGFFFLFLVQGGVFTAAQLLNLSFGKATLLMLVILAGCDLLALLLCQRQIRETIARIRNGRKENRQGNLQLWLIGWLWLGMLLVLSTGSEGNRLDAVLETVQTTLYTDTMNRFHPFTGQEMELGVILSKKVLTLPFWYAALARWTGFSAAETVLVLGSFLTITASLMAFTQLANLVMGRKTRENWLFVVLLELLILSGAYATAASGYRLLFYGYSGETIVGMAALPMLLCVLYRLCIPLLLGRHSRVRQEDQLGVWGALVKLGLLFGSSLFLAPLTWGPILLLIGTVLFVICLCLVLWINRSR